MPLPRDDGSYPLRLAERRTGAPTQKECSTYGGTVSWILRTKRRLSGFAELPMELAWCPHTGTWPHTWSCSQKRLGSSGREEGE